MFECIRHQLMCWFDERRTLEDKTNGLLVSKATEHLQFLANDRARRYRFEVSIPGGLFEVKSMETQRNYIVNLAEQTVTNLGRKPFVDKNSHCRT